MVLIGAAWLEAVKSGNELPEPQVPLTHPRPSSASFIVHATEGHSGNVTSMKQLDGCWRCSKGDAEMDGMDKIQIECS